MHEHLESDLLEKVHLSNNLISVKFHMFKLGETAVSVDYLELKRTNKYNPISAMIIRAI